MAENKMIVADGVRYRAEDAERLGLQADSDKSGAGKKPAAEHKMRKPKETARGGDAASAGDS
jgi:hypothetical protein